MTVHRAGALIAAGVCPTFGKWLTHVLELDLSGETLPLWPRTEGAGVPTTHIHILKECPPLGSHVTVLSASVC